MGFFSLIKMQTLNHNKTGLESNDSCNYVLPLFFPTDSHPYSLSDLVQNHMNTSHTIRAHAQKV